MSEASFLQLVSKFLRRAADLFDGLLTSHWTDSDLDTLTQIPAARHDALYAARNWSRNRLFPELQKYLPTVQFDQYPHNPEGLVNFEVTQVQDREPSIRPRPWTLLSHIETLQELGSVVILRVVDTKPRSPIVGCILVVRIVNFNPEDNRGNLYWDLWNDRSLIGGGHAEETIAAMALSIATTINTELLWETTKT